jgi:hypothetical protein
LTVSFKKGVKTRGFWDLVFKDLAKIKEMIEKSMGFAK